MNLELFWPETKSHAAHHQVYEWTHMSKQTSRGEARFKGIINPVLKMNPYEVLADREHSELDLCQQNIDLFNKYINDYQCLEERLSTLSDRTRHDIMVPVAGSKLAFMPGYIHHTNEVMVLLGENYFVEKSTKEAIEFIHRRIKFCKSKLEELETQRKLLQNWIGATNTVKSETSELVEINETWTEEEVDKWMVKHQQKVKEDRKKHTDVDHHDVDINKILEKYAMEEELAKQNVAKERKVHFSQDVKEQDNERTEPMPSRPISKFKASRMNR